MCIVLTHARTTTHTHTPPHTHTHIDEQATEHFLRNPAQMPESPQVGDLPRAKTRAAKHDRESRRKFLGSRIFDAKHPPHTPTPTQVTRARHSLLRAVGAYAWRPASTEVEGVGGGEEVGGEKVGASTWLDTVVPPLNPKSAYF